MHNTIKNIITKYTSLTRKVTLCVRVVTSCFSKNSPHPNTRGVASCSYRGSVNQNTRGAALRNREAMGKGRSSGVKFSGVKVVSLMMSVIFILLSTLVFPAFVPRTNAAPNYQMNYQGKLTNASNVAVADGTYNMRFWLLTSGTIATTSAVWSETLTGTNKVQVTNGLFSVMLGSTSPLTGVDFNQTLYLGVEIGGTSTPGWDGEMSPRKTLGTMPSAFEADKLDGLTSTQFVRTDATTTIATSSADTLLTITQNGIGDILNLFDGTTEVFTVVDGGNVGIGTTSPSRKLTIQGGDAYVGGNLTATGTATFANLLVSGSSTIGGGTGATGLTINGTATTTNLKVTSLTASRAIFTDASNLLTTTGLSQYLIDSLSDETGTGFAVFSASPTFTGTALFASLSASGSSTIGGGTGATGLTINGTATTTLGLIMSGSASNISLGSNYLSGDGGDEGIFVDASGNVGVGTSTPYAKLTIAGEALADYFTATGITSTTTLMGGLNVGSGAITYDHASGLTTIQNMAFGAMNFDSDAGIVTWVDMPVTSASATGTVMSYSANIAGTSTLTVYAESAGNGGAENFRVGIGSSTPTRTLTVSGDGWFTGNVTAASSTLGYASSTSFTTGALRATASSTIGDGTGAGGLTVSGTATTTNLKVTSLTASRAIFTDASNLLTTTGLSQYLIDSLSDETGTGNLVFSTNPLLTGFRSSASSTIGDGTANGGLTINGTATSTLGLIMSGSASNISLGSNYLSGDGGDEGIFVDASGNVGIGTTTPSSQLTIANFSASSTSRPFFDITASTTDGSNTSYQNSFFRISYASSTEIFGKVIDPEFVAEEQGTTPGTTLDAATSVFVSGNYAYVANYGRASMAVIDISNPADPVFVSEERGPSPGISLQGAQSVSVLGNYAYVVNYERDSLVVIDISNPADPVFISEERGPTPGTSLGGPSWISISGNYAYVANYDRASLAVIDISNPADPIFISEERGPIPGTSLNSANSLFVSGNYAYLANQGNASLAIIDISNPADPVFISEERGTTPGTTLAGATSVFVSSKYAYVTNHTRDSLAVIDISNPADPVFISEERGPIPGTSFDGAQTVFVSGNYAYVTNNNRASLAVIDISNPADPVFISEERGPTPGTSLDGVYPVFVSGNYAYLANGNRDSLAVIDVGGATVSNLAAGTAKIGNLQVDSFAQFAQGALFGGGLGVQGNIFANGGGSFMRMGTTTPLASTTLSWGNTPTTPALSALVIDGASSGISDVFSLSHLATSTAASSGIGTGILFNSSVVDGATTTATSTSRIASILTNVSASSPASVLTFSNKNTSGLLTEFMRLDHQGYLGLGTTSPSRKLTVAGGDGWFGGNLTATGTATFANLLVTGSSTIGGGTGATGLTINGTATTTNLKITSLSDGCLSTASGLVTSSGSPCGSGGGSSNWLFDGTRLTPSTTVGIGIFASSTIGGGTGSTGLTINGTATTTLGLIMSGSASNISLGSNYLSGDGGDEGIYVDASGNVGIGTSSPGAMLDVAGNVLLSGNANRTLSVGGNGTYGLTLSGAAYTGNIGGSAVLQGGNSNSGIITAGGGFDAWNGGDITLLAGTAANNNAGPGSISITAGAGHQASGNAQGGNVTIAAGRGGSNGAAGGKIFIVGGQGGGSSTLHGDVILAHTGSVARGNVGIGTTTPSSQLTIANFSASSTSRPFFDITASTTDGSNTSYQNSFFRISYASSTEIFGKVIDPEFVAEEQGTTPDTSLNSPYSVFVSGNYAYMANAGRDSLAVIDISNPADPVFVSEERGPTPGTSLDYAFSVFVSGNYAYVANFNRASLAVIDISNPADPVFVSEERGPTPGTSLNGATSVFVSGNYAYMANSNRDSLAVINISNPADPVFISEELGPTAGTSLDGAWSLFVSGNYAYVTNLNRDSLAVIDISNPADPVFLSEERGPTPSTSLNGAVSVFVSGRYAYVANFDRDSLAVIDISNPADPVFISEELGPTAGTSLDAAQSVFVSGNYAYMANSTRDSLAVIDISNPADPVFISEERGPTPGTSLDAADFVFVSGNYAYVANASRNSLAVIDVGGATISNLAAGTAKIGNLQVDAFALFSGGAHIGGGLGIGAGGLFSQGAGSFTRMGTTTPLASTTLSWGNTPTTPALSALIIDGASSGVSDVFSLSHLATSTAAAAGIGTGILFNSSVVSGATISATSTSRIASILTNVSSSTPQSVLTFANKNTSGVLTEFMRLDHQGYLGLGTTSPSRKLTVAGGDGWFGGNLTATGTATFANLLVTGSSTIGGGTGATGLIINGTATTTLGLIMSGSASNISLGSNYLSGDGGDEGIYVDASGNVGIGTTTSTARLTIQGTAGATASLLRTATSTGTTTFEVLASGDVEVANNLISKGVTWTARTAVASNGWNSVTYGNGLFVAVGEVGIVMTSPDGSTWTARSAAEANWWNSVTYGNGLFVAVSWDGTNRVMTSPDGITWTARSASVADTWQSITYGNGMFVAVSNTTNSYIMTSPDGITWTTRLTVSGADFLGATYGNGLFVVVTEAGASGVYTSPDGITWTRRPSASSTTSYLGVAYGNGTFVAVGSSGSTTAAVMTSGKSEFNQIATGNIFQGGMSILGGVFNIGTTTGTTSPFASNILNVASTTGTSVLTITGAGNVGIGTTTPTSLLTMGASALSGARVAGMKQYFGFVNSVESALYYGDETYIVNAPTATSTLVGKMLRIEDSTALGNVVRGFEAQAHRGTNTKGENTGLSGFGRTFGVRGTTIGDAGNTFLPAGVFAESQGTTQGNALRAYSGTMTTEDLVSLFHDTSAFTGTGLQMNFGNTTGSFAATSTAKFLDLQVAGTSKFIISANGSTTLGDGTVNASLMIPRGGICVDNDGSCISTTTGQIRSVTSALGNSDLAEMYFSRDALEKGEIVALSGGLSVTRASGASAQNIIGVVSTKPGMTLGFDDTSLSIGETAYPIGLKGRVPIQLSTENGPIKKGDRITLSSIAGIGMKATESSRVVGIALEDYDGTRAYSAGYLNQFGDDMVKDRITEKTVIDPRTQDGCYNGGGNALGESPCTPEKVTKTTVTTVTDNTAYKTMLITLTNEAPRTRTTPNGTEVTIGHALMFIELTNYQIADETTILQELTATSSLENNTGTDTLWSRLKGLAHNFVNGILTLTGLKADRVEVKNELCVDGVCMNASDLRALLQSVRGGVSVPPTTGESSSDTATEIIGGSSGAEASGEVGGESLSPDPTTPPPEEPPVTEAISGEVSSSEEIEESPPPEAEPPPSEPSPPP